jgi:hypothetical protein
LAPSESAIGWLSMNHAKLLLGIPRVRNSWERY